jgi:hypothetical protein
LIGIEIRIDDWGLDEIRLDNGYEDEGTWAWAWEWGIHEWDEANGDTRIMTVTIAMENVMR